jgi:hypothetical protein
LQAGGTVATVSTLAVDLRSTVGYLVADAAGRLVGRVECPLYGTRPDEPDALSVRGRFFARRHLVPADAICEIDERSRVIGLHLERHQIRTFF